MVRISQIRNHSGTLCKSRILTLLLFLTAFFLLGLATSVQAASIGVTIDGEAVSFTDASGSPFLDAANRTQVPFRKTMETFGATVSWDQDKQTAVAQKNGITVKVPIGAYYIEKNGERITNDTAALIRDGRTYLPIRKVLEAFGATVSWNATSNSVAVASGGGGTNPPTLPTVPVPEPSASNGYFNTKDLSKGLIHVTASDGGKLKVIIEKNGVKYTYDQNSTGVKETYPLQLGNGTYKVSLLSNISGTSYRLISSQSVTVNLSSSNDVFLGSIQPISWDVDSKAVLKAVELTKGAKTVQEKAKLLWKYMYQNNSYDYTKAATVSTGYIPVVDRTLVEKKGICYDFSSLYAAMLRSQGTPAKLIKGYAPDYASGYHAWNEVYDTVAGKWVVVDTTYDLQIYAKSKTPLMNKDSGGFSKLYEY